MSADSNEQGNERISLDDNGEEGHTGPVPVPPPAQQGNAHDPVPVPPPGAESPAEGDAQDHEPVPVPPPAAKKAEETPIQLVEADDVKPAKRKAFGSAAARAGFAIKTEFQRDLNLDGTGATRCKLFHSRIADGPLLHMETLINEWLDENEIEVKFATQTIGMMEGKRSEPNLLMMIWY